MEDEGESESDFRTIIDGIVTYNDIPHQINKRANKIRFNKRQNNRDLL